MAQLSMTQRNYTALGQSDPVYNRFKGKIKNKYLKKKKKSGVHPCCARIDVPERLATCRFFFI